MAEAIVNARYPEWKAYSAGTTPAGYVHEMAIETLAAIRITHSGESKDISDLPTRDFDLVVTVCDSAAEECPVWLGKGKRAHHSFSDPAKIDNIDDFRKVRDDIARGIPELLRQFG